MVRMNLHNNPGQSLSITIIVGKSLICVLNKNKGTFFKLGVEALQ